MKPIGFKIRKVNSQLYSQGVIQSAGHGDGKYYYVNWTSRKGKVWETEKALKEHLLKYTKLVGKPTDWEIIEVGEAPTKPLDDWFDATMVLKLLKR